MTQRTIEEWAGLSAQEAQAYAAAFAQQRESAMARAVFRSAQEWMGAGRMYPTTTEVAEYKRAAAHYSEMVKQVRSVAAVTVQIGGQPSLRVAGVIAVPDQEHVHEIGYINDERKHALISIRHPALANVPHTGMVQIAITIETAVDLRAELNAFLARHGVATN